MPELRYNTPAGRVLVEPVPARQVTAGSVICCPLPGLALAGSDLCLVVGEVGSNRDRPDYLYVRAIQPGPPPAEEAEGLSSHVAVSYGPGGDARWWVSYAPRLRADDGIIACDPGHLDVTLDQVVDCEDPDLAALTAGAVN